MRPANIPNVTKKRPAKVKPTLINAPDELREKFQAKCYALGLSMTAVTLEQWQKWLDEPQPKKGGE